MAHTMEVDIAPDNLPNNGASKSWNNLALETSNASLNGSELKVTSKCTTPTPDSQGDISLTKPNSLQLKTQFSSSIASPKVRRLSTNGNVQVTPRTPSRLDQIKFEESFGMVSKEAESERAMLDTKKFADACSDWSLSDDDNVGVGEYSKASKVCRPVSEQLHVFTSPSTLSFPQTCSPSPTRFTKGAILNPGRSFTPSPSPSPTRRTGIYTHRRSVSPVVALKPSLIGTKRKIDTEMFDRMDNQIVQSPIKRPALQQPNWSNENIVENNFSPSNGNLSNGSGNDSGIDSPDLQCLQRPQPASSCPLRWRPTTPPFNQLRLKANVVPSTQTVSSTSGSAVDSEDNCSIASNDDELQRFSDQSSLLLSNNSRSDEFFTPVSLSMKTPMSCPASPSVRNLAHPRPLSASCEGNPFRIISSEQLRQTNPFCLPFNRKPAVVPHRMRSLSSGPSSSSTHEIFSESLTSSSKMPFSPLLTQSEIMTRSKNNFSHLLTTPNNSPNPHSDSSMTDEEK